MVALPLFIYGTDGDDELALPFGIDGTLIGLAGNDVYIIHGTDFTIVEQPGSGIDTVRTDIQFFTLPENVENLVYLSQGFGMDVPFHGTGNALANVIQGGDNDDFLDGGAGNDTLIGGFGADTYIVNSAGDKIIEVGLDVDSFGQPFRDRVFAQVSYVLPANVEDLLLDNQAETGNLNGTGNALDNAVTGDFDNNVLSGLGGNDTLHGEEGNDTLFGGDGNDTLFGGDDDDTLDGGAGNDELHGDDGTNTLRGGGGNDDLYASTANQDTLAGNAGNDTYHLIGASATIVEAAGQGTDTVETDAAVYTLQANVEVLRYVGIGMATQTGNAGNNWLYGGTLADTLIGLAGNDYLDGGGSGDRMEGGSGSDTYFVDSSADTIVELTGAGVDTVYASISYAVPDNVENLTFVESPLAFFGFGNGLNNVLIGNSSVNRLESGAGNDSLDGGAGDDTLIGGAGNDTYLLDSFGDQVVELVGEGTDSAVLKPGVSGIYWMPANLENLQIVTPQFFVNVTVHGNDDANRIIGGLGGDKLDGGAGADRLEGGDGSDAYYVDQAGDVVVEAAGKGSDLIFSTVNLILPANVEGLTLVGSATNGTGNALGNTIDGNALNNTLSGMAGNDFLSGYLGSDVLSGGDGNDVLDGGGDDDVMAGGAGNDIYYVDSIGDTVTEAAAGGTDRVYSTAYSTVLANGVENLNLAFGSAATIGSGNALNNVITGNDAANILGGFAGNDWLDGGLGADDMAGNAGDDTYIVDNVGDLVHENVGEGNDTIRTSVNLYLPTFAPQVENLVLIGNVNGNATGNALSNTLTGDSTDNQLSGFEGNDVLVGGGGNDILDGGAGNDRMSGGTGNDTYFVEQPGDVVTEASNQGLDTVWTSLVAYVLPANVENGVVFDEGIKLTGNPLDNLLTGDEAEGSVTLDGGAGNDTLVGGADNDVLIGGTGNDLIDGNNGNDQMTGGAGDDTYEVNSGDGAGSGFTGASEDQVIELAGQGIDTVHVTNRPNYVLPANVENFEFEGTTALAFTGNELANRLTLNAAAQGTVAALGGNDVIDLLVPGGPAIQAQVLDGGAGADRLDVDLFAGVTLSSANIETMQFTANLAAVVATASGMTGVGEVTVKGSANLTLPAIGGIGAGTPHYIFDGYNGAADLAVVNAAANGNDVLDIDLHNTALLDLGLADVETLVFNVSGFPLNELKLGRVIGLPDVIVTGNAVLDILNGVSSFDSLTLSNFAGARMGLTAGTPANPQTIDLNLDGTVTTMFEIFGLGTDADTINFDAHAGSFAHLLVSGDSAADNFTLTGAGNLVLDEVDAGSFSAGNFSGSLRATFSSATAFSVSGLANGRYDLAGAGANADSFAFGTALDAQDNVEGGAGADSLSANISGLGLGNGTLHIAHVESIVFTVNSATSIDASAVTASGLAVTLNGSGPLTVVNASGSWNGDALTGPLKLAASNAVNVTGTAANDTIAGVAGTNFSDTFNGRLGNDTLSGGGGTDVFVFDTALDTSTNVDTLLDFDPVADTMQLENAIFTALAAPGGLAAANFFAASSIVDTSGADANDFIKYNTSTGALYYDSNGSTAGGMTQFAQVNFGAAHPVLTNADFVVI